MMINKLMPDFFNDNFALIGLISAVTILFGWNIFIYSKLRNIQNNLKAFFQGSKAVDLEEVLFRQIKESRQTKDSVDALSKELENLKNITSYSIKKVGIVRFNPFKETGGDQSFAIAFLDSHDTGLVISSLFTREGTRIYSKPIESGSSEYPLSNEEQKALKKAGLGK